MNRFSYFLKSNIRLLLGLSVVIFFFILIGILVMGKLNRTQVTINNQEFKVSVARSDRDKQTGLSKTKKLDENRGMLFVFDKADYYRFWMKEMEFPIDIIYIKGNKVTTVIPNAPVATIDKLIVYEPAQKSDRVLEINAGLAKKYNIKEGSTVEIDNL